MYDIFFLRFDEPMADGHWAALKSRIISARVMSGVKGIHAAHLACAKASRTACFFVIDADNEIIDYDFSYKVPTWDMQYVHLWQAHNPVNGLTYGWGGVKLFPKKLVLGMSPDTLDMTTSFPLKVMPEVKSINHFNYAPFETWRSAFRECVKLTLSDDPEALARRDVWVSKATGPYSGECLAGARAGVHYAYANKDDPAAIRKINDYAWLRSFYESGGS